MQFFTGKYHNDTANWYHENELNCRCPGDIQDEYKIQFLLDEVPIDITDDCDEGFCTWQSFKKKYYKTAHSCNIDFCNKKNNNY